LSNGDQDEVAPGSPAGPRYLLRLFVSGTTARSTRAIENLKRLCDELLRERYTLEIIDIYQHPEAARDHQIVAAPTLVKVLPEPMRRIIGDLANTERVLHGLSLSGAAPTMTNVSGDGA
jgi:circadian clock protein KaiB